MSIRKKNYLSHITHNKFLKLNYVKYSKNTEPLRKHYLNSVFKYCRFMRDRYVNNKSITRNKSQYQKIKMEFGKKLQIYSC